MFPNDFVFNTFYPKSFHCCSSILLNQCRNHESSPIIPILSLRNPIPPQLHRMGSFMKSLENRVISAIKPPLWTLSGVHYNNNVIVNLVS